MALLQAIPKTSSDRITTEIQLPAVPQTALMMYMSAAAAYAGSFLYHQIFNSENNSSKNFSVLNTTVFSFSVQFSRNEWNSSEEDGCSSESMRISSAETSSALAR